MREARIDELDVFVKLYDVGSKIARAGKVVEVLIGDVVHDLKEVADKNEQKVTLSVNKLLNTFDSLSEVSRMIDEALNELMMAMKEIKQLLGGDK